MHSRHTRRRVANLLGRVILHTPFASFNILLTHAIRTLNLAELDRLDCFAASLRVQPLPDPNPPLTHPQRLYELLCLAARLWIYSSNSTSAGMSTQTENDLMGSMADFDFSRLRGGELLPANPASSELQQAGTASLEDWLLDDEML